MQRVPYTLPLYNLPPELKIFQRSFLFFFPFQLDKIKVGGNSCLPQHFNKISSPYYRTGDSAGMLSNKRGVTFEFRITLIVVCFLALFSKVVLGIEWKMNPILGFKCTLR